MSQMTTFVVDPKKFEIFKEINGRDYKNFVAEQPYHHAMHWFSAVVASCKWTTPEMAAALEGKDQVISVHISFICCCCAC